MGTAWLQSSVWVSNVDKAVGMGLCCSRAALGNGCRKKSCNQCFLATREVLGGSYPISRQSQDPFPQLWPKGLIGLIGYSVWLKLL